MSALAPTFGNPAAQLGFVGFVKFQIPGAADGGLVRARSADLRLAQEITKPDVVDSRFDRTVYQLGPKIVEGSIEYPAIFRRGSTGTTIAEDLWTRAVERDSTGHLQTTDIQIKYASDNASFTFEQSIVDSYTFSVAQSDLVSITTNIIGGGRAGSASFSEPDDIDNVRVVTWNDAAVTINLLGGGSFAGTTISGAYIRSFNVTIANNAQRFYTLNGFLLPQDIAPTKRDVTGTLVLLGRHQALGSRAENNEERCFEESTITFGYEARGTAECGGGFARVLPNCVFEIEEVALTNDLFETTVNYHSLPAASTSSDPLETPGTLTFPT